MGGGGGPIGDAFDKVTGVATKALEPVFEPFSEALQPIAEAIPGGEILVPAALAMVPGAGPYLAGGYHMGQGDPVAAMMSAGLGGFSPFGGGGQQGNPFSKIWGSQTAPNFLQQGGQTMFEKMASQAKNELIKSGLRKGIGQLAEDLGITSKEAGAAAADLGMGSVTGGSDLSGDYAAMTGITGSGDPDTGIPGRGAPGGSDVETGGKPPTEKQIKKDGENKWWAWVQEKAPKLYDWGKEHGIEVAAVVAAVYAGMGGMQGEQEPLPEQKPSKVSEEYGTELSGAPGRVVQNLQPIYSETETVGGVPKIIGYENIAGPQYISPEREDYLETQTAAHGGLMSLQEGGLVDEEEQVLRDAMGSDIEDPFKMQGIINNILRAKSLQIGEKQQDGEFYTKRDYEKDTQVIRDAVDTFGTSGAMPNPFGTSGALSNFLGEPERRLTIDELKNADKNRMLLENMDRERRERAWQHHILEQERLRKEQERRGTSPEGLGPQGLYRTRPSVEVNPMAGGGFPRKTGAINGPGTGTSDSIPAMLSDGEFVMTSDAVRGAGMGNRMAGAKRMYDMMNKFEGMA